MSPEDFLDALINNSPSYIMILDLSGTIRFANRTIENVSAGEMLGQPVFSFLATQKEKDQLKHCFDQIVTTKTVQLLEHRTVSRKSKVNYWESRISPMLDNGEVTGFIIFTNNVTATKFALLEQRAIFNLSRDFLGILKFDGFFSQVNPAFTYKLGYTEEELLSTPFIELIHPDDREMTSKAFSEDTTQGSGKEPIVNRYVSKSGKVISIEWRGHIDADTKGIVVVGRDITANIEIDQRLRQAEKMEAIGQLAGGIAHDFNNLLMAISANAELGLISTNTADISNHLRNIEAASTRASELTQKLLTLSRLQPLQKTTLDLNYLVQNYLPALKSTLPTAVQINFKPAPSVLQVAGDKTQLEQVLMNLCLNARDAMDASGSITISTALYSRPDQPNKVHLDITDTGSGISSAISEKVYDPFFTTKANGQVSGLGLSMAYGIMKKHNGNIEILSTGESGTTMRVSFPSAEKVKKPENTGSQSLPFGGSETILVADDEPLVAKITKETLEKAGYSVLLARDGVEAVELCESNQSIDLAFLDVMMPQMGGPEAALIIKKKAPKLPILFASGYAPNSQNKIEGDYLLLEKPYRGDELLNNIRKLLDKNDRS